MKALHIDTTLKNLNSIKAIKKRNTYKNKFLESIAEKLFSNYEDKLYLPKEKIENIIQDILEKNSQFIFNYKLSEDSLKKLFKHDISGTVELSKDIDINNLKNKLIEKNLDGDKSYFYIKNSDFLFYLEYKGGEWFYGSDKKLDLESFKNNFVFLFYLFILNKIISLIKKK